MPPAVSPVSPARCALALLLVWTLHEFAGLEGAFVQGDADALRTLIIAAIVLVSALVASIAGFAFCALAGSALAFLQVDPVEAVRTMVICSTAIQLYAVWKIRDAIRWAPLWPMIAAGATTVPLGVWLLLHVPGDAYGVGLGIFLCAYGCYAVFRRGDLVVRGSPWRDAVAGALGGLAGGLAGLSGSFVTIWCSMRGWDKHAQRAVYQPFILVMQVVTIACLQVARSTKLVDGVGFVPFALLGGIAGFAIYQRLTNRQFNAAVSALLMVSGLGLLSRSL